MFRFHEGQIVRLHVDRPSLELRAGDIGVVWSAYATEPPSYEVTFSSKSEGSFDMTLDEGDIVAVDVDLSKPGTEKVEAA